MKKYLSFFRLRFSMGLQYRAAAIGGIACQFFWGILLILMYQAFYRSDQTAFPMTMEAITSYVWLEEAFIAIFNMWVMESEIFNAIQNGDIAYELCRPIHIYSMWFVRSVANRLSKVVLRCIPILIIAAFLPKGYRFELPYSLEAGLLFFLTLLFGFLVNVAMCMIVYLMTFYTISPLGLRIFSISITEFFSGAVIPLPFFPDKMQRIMELLPFASIQNVPLRIYSGNLTGQAMWQAIGMQIFWFIVLILIGYSMSNSAIRKVVIQGG